MIQDPKEIIRTWYFSSSSGAAMYETIQRADGGLSCGCPGWTRRVGKDGTRTCRHVREVVAFDGNPPSCNASNYLVEENGTPVKPMAFKDLVPLLQKKEKEQEPEDPYARSMNI